MKCKEMSLRFGLKLNIIKYEESKTDIYDYVIANNNLEKSFKIIKTIIEEEKKI